MLNKSKSNNSTNLNDNNESSANEEIIVGNISNTQSYFNRTKMEHENSYNRQSEYK
jgi:hypothetical protein